MAEKVTKLALASRIFILLFQLMANAVIPDHKTDVFRSPFSPNEKTSWLDRSVRYCLKGLRHWDGEYFLHIAEHGYSYENTMAFYPLFPLLVRWGAFIVHAVFGDFLNMRSCCLLVGVALNILLFCKAANVLYALTQRIFNDLNKSWNVALLFCFNPASIFFSAVYSESLFCLLSLYVMLESSTQIRVVRSLFVLALNILTRSNGLLNLGFPVYFIARKFLIKQSSLLTSMLKILICVIVAWISLSFFNFYAYRLFCLKEKYAVNHTDVVVQYGRHKRYILAGYHNMKYPGWCFDEYPFPYSYIQSEYWDVGFLKYYQLKQIPNFLLALPILSFLMWNCIKYFTNFFRNLLAKNSFIQLLKDYKTLPFVVHAFFLSLFCILFVHIQISTRLLCAASPCVYWFAADYMPKSLEKLQLRSKAGLIFLWFSSYALVGTVMFSNNLPWT